MIEYAIGLAVLFAIFAIAAQNLQISGEFRANSSNQVVEEILPCQGILSAAAGGDGCK